MSVAAVAVDPRRGPACPGCKCTLGTPISRVTGVERWDGPADATLWCPACGLGWVGTADDVVEAVLSWNAYENEVSPVRAEAARRIIERWKYTAPGLTNAELALLERFVSELETA